jgi:hypothetical protein
LFDAPRALRNWCRAQPDLFGSTVQASFIVLYNEPALFLQANSARAIEKTMSVEPPALILAKQFRIHE